MKRSRVNEIIEIAKEAFHAVGFTLPPFAYWTTDEWKDKGPEVDEIRACMLGWDVTDFGLGKFDEYGRVLLTMRNGSSKFATAKDYAEKLILDPVNQKPPLHFHRHKMEDIINRGGGTLMIRLYQATEDGECSKEAFTVQQDGVTRRCASGEIVELEAGQSLAIPPRLIHQFWNKEGTGLLIRGGHYTVSGEISRVCDDWNDNVFLEPCERFPGIEEDEPPVHYLVHEYPGK